MGVGVKHVVFVDNQHFNDAGLKRKVDQHLQRLVSISVKEKGYVDDIPNATRSIAMNSSRLYKKLKIQEKMIYKSVKIGRLLSMPGILAPPIPNL